MTNDQLVRFVGGGTPYKPQTLRVSPAETLREQQSLMGETPKTALLHPKPQMTNDK